MPASTPIPKSRSASTSPKGARCARRRRRRGCGSAARRTPSSAAATRRRARRRRGRYRPAGRRHRVLHVPGPRALAPEPGLLLQDGRRADARHGALLCHGPRQSARTGRRGRGLRGDAARERTITSEPRNGETIAVEVPTHVAGDAALRRRRDRPDRDELRRCRPPPHADRDLWHRGLDRSSPTPTASAARSRSAQGRRMGGTAGHEHAYADGNYRSLGVADMAHAHPHGRPHRARARWRCTCSR